MFDEIKQSVDVESAIIPIGFDRFLSKKVSTHIWDKAQRNEVSVNGTVESVYLKDGYPLFVVQTDDGLLLIRKGGDLIICGSGGEKK
jgi:hypothetical protein